MAKNEFAELFAGLTKDEFNRFGDFIRSPFFEAPNRIINLYNLIEKKYDTLTVSPLSREEISDSFYPGRKYEDTQLNVRKLISEFKKFYEEFLSELEYRSQDFHRNLFLLKQLAKREKADEFDNVFDKTNLLLELRSIRDEEYYLFKINLLAEAYKNENVTFKKFEDDLAFKIQELVDLYYYAYKMYLFQRIEVKAFVLNKKMDSYGKFYVDILEDIKSNKDYFHDHPEIYARFLHLSFLANYNEKSNIADFISYLDSVSMNLNIDCYFHYIDMIDFCSRMVINGFNEYRNKILEITKILDKKELFFNHIIADNIFKIIIESFIGEKQYAESLNFLNKYKDKQELNNNNGFINLSYSKAYFFMNNYPESRKHLTKVNYNDFVHYVDAKLIEVRINYEEKQFNEVFSILDTVKKYIKQHKEIGTIYKQSYLNFINYLTSAIRIYENERKGTDEDFNKQKLISNIESTKFLYGNYWLLDKVKEI